MNAVRLFRHLACLLGICGSAACSFVSGSGNDELVERTSTNRTPSSILRKMVRTGYNDRGETSYVLKAREGRIFEKENFIYLTDFVISFYRGGQAVSFLRARRGIIERQSERLQAHLDVFLLSDNGRTLKTSEVYGDNSQQIITNAVYNVITDVDGSVLTGTHLWAHNDLGVFRLRDARGTVPVTLVTNQGER